MRLDFWFDPGCPWTWITSRWITEVAERRDLDVRWRSFSLLTKNAPVPERTRAGSEAAHRALRVVEAVRAGYGEQAVGTLYTALGRRIHALGDVELDGLPAALEEAGIEPGYAARATDGALDEPILASMDEAIRSAGEQTGAPTLRLGSGPAYFGPILSPAPTGQEALRLFDALVALLEAGAGTFFELKRHRDHGPELPVPP
jgi:2-hydroxychromene-2-carboxylate isomerase